MTPEQKQQSNQVLFLITEYEVGAARGLWVLNLLGLKRLWTWWVYKRITIKITRWQQFREEKHKHELRP